MRVAVRYRDAAELSFAAELARIFEDYGVEVVGALAAKTPVPEGVDAVIAPPGAAADGERALEALTPEAARRAAAELVGEKRFAVFATYGVAAEEIARRARGLGRGAIGVAVRPSRSGAYVIVRYGERAAKVDVDAVSDAVRAEFADCIYAERECELEEFLIERLKSLKQRIAVAESFTGGGVTARLTGVPGASAVVAEGIVAYTEAAKTDRLGVSAETIAFHSAVSANAAYQMATGLLGTGRAEIVAATTGYAGPEGRDVGKCFIAVGDARRIHIFEYRFSGSRADVTAQGVRATLDRLADTLLVKVK